jgi:hypothetical protein
VSELESRGKDTYGKLKVSAKRQWKGLGLSEINLTLLYLTVLFSCVRNEAMTVSRCSWMMKNVGGCADFFSYFRVWIEKSRDYAGRTCFVACQLPLLAEKRREVVDQVMTRSGSITSQLVRDTGSFNCQSNLEICLSLFLVPLDT